MRRWRKSRSKATARSSISIRPRRSQPRGKASVSLNDYPERRQWEPRTPENAHARGQLRSLPTELLSRLQERLIAACEREGVGAGIDAIPGNRRSQRKQPHPLEASVAVK